jgi:Fe-S cluster assembly protein SufD
MTQILLQKILAKGFPTHNDEQWKYTNVNHIALKAFKLANRKEVMPDFYTTHIVSENYIIFINGYMVKISLPVEIMYSENVKNNPGNVKLSADIFENLNQHFFQDGLILNITETLKNPLQILYISVEPNWVQPRNQIILSENCEATIIETFLSTTSAVTNIHTDIELKFHSKLSYFKIQQENPNAFHIGRTNIFAHRNSLVKTFTISTGGLLARSDINIKLAGEGAETELYGLYITKNRIHLDHHTVVEHGATKTKSKELYHGILMDQSRAVFNGKVIVHPQANRTEAKQQNHNLLLSSEAEIDTKPELEIYCDDIKCTHGATIGQLDDKALFYLRARGLDENSAKKLLIHAFLNEILSYIPDNNLRSIFQQKYCSL